jgi:surface polysaccharide O-acyltransferase-like enzyme
MQKQQSPRIPVDLIRTMAVLGVLLLHSANDLTIQTMSSMEIGRWIIVDIYQSVGRMGVPLFVMLTGALLLAPSKQGEELGVFFKKRFSRIGLPFIFWAAAYFIWDAYVEYQPVTQGFFVNGLLTGPYFTFWYLYMLMGLYLLTPFLRLMVAQASEKLFKYFLVIWFVGSALVPIVAAFSSYHLDPNLFIIPGYVGYFVLGAYLVNVKVRRIYLAALMAFGIALTAIFTYFVAMNIGGGTTYFFQEYLSPTMILAAISFFLLLNSSSANSEEKTSHQPRIRKVLKVISDNTLPIFLFHMMVIYALQNGLFFGFTLNGNTVNSIVGVPLMAGLTLLICLAVIIPLKRVPIIKRLIG